MSRARRLPRMAIFEAGVPVLGICYGEQAMAHQLGGKVEGGHHREFGRAEVEVTKANALFEGVWEVGQKYPVWMSHGDRVTKLPDGFVTVGTSLNAPIAMIADEKRKFYATQFHLEVMHTPHGAAIIRNFVRKIAGATGDWTMRAFKEEAIEKIRGAGRQGQGDLRALGRRRLGGRGGADPRGDRRPAHLRVRRPRPAAARRGRRRSWRCSATATTSRSSMSKRSRCSSARSRASPTRRRSARPSASCSSTCSRPRRRRSPRRQGIAEFLAQGTLYPDVIESVSFTGGPSVTIKSHHNVGGLPERMNMKLVEPLRELFKDEVRALGRELGLPEVFVGRHPFPGPGLAIRCPGEITREKLDILRLADEIYHRGNPPRRPLRRDLAGLRGAAAGAHRRRDGRRPHLRLRRRRCAP